MSAGPALVRAAFAFTLASGFSALGSERRVVLFGLEASVLAVAVCSAASVVFWYLGRRRTS